MRLRPVPLLPPVLALALTGPLFAADEPQPFPDMAPEIGKLLQANYYDKQRIVPRLMVQRALRAIENSEVTADGDWQGEILTFRIQDRRIEIPAPEPRTLDAGMVLIERLRDEVDATSFPAERKRQLAYALLNGALSTLDPHTYVEPPEPSKQNTFEDITGEFFGIGAFLTSDDGQVAIERVMTGLPAERSGVLDGDRILAIDGERTAGLSLDQAVRRIKGPKGTPVRLTLERPTTNQTLDLTVIRDLVQVIVFRAHRAGDIGYVRLDSFNANAAAQLRQGWLDLQKEGPLKAMVLDMRFNGGGLLDQAKLICDFFLARNQEVVRTVAANGDSNPPMYTSGRRMIDVPVLVLVSGISASAAEIVSGALQRNDRAAIIGATTYGKGSVQIMKPLRDGSRLRITTQEYQLPGGVSIQDLGVQPDIKLVRRSVRDQAGTAVDLLPYSPPREQDDEFALANTKAYRHRTAYELPWLAEFLSPEALKRSSISAREFQPDPEAQLAIDLLAAAAAKPEFSAGWTQALKDNQGRQYLIDQLKDPVATFAEKQAQRLGEALAKLPAPVAWGGPQPAAPGSLSAMFTGPLAITAGGSVSLGFTVSNPGTADLGRLYGLVQSDKFSPLWESEVLFGTVPAGGSITGALAWRVPPRLYTGEERFTLELRGAGDQPVADIPVRLQIQGAPRPHLSFEWTLKGETQLKTGTQSTIQLRFLNSGSAPSAKLALRVLKDDDVFVQLNGSPQRSVEPLAPQAASAWIDIPVQIANELKNQRFSADHITLELRAEEQFDDTPDQGRHRLTLLASFTVPVGVELPGKPKSYHPPELHLAGITHTGANLAEVSVRLDDENPTFVTAFLDEDKVFLAKVGSERTFTFPVKLKPGANNLRVVAMDSDELQDGLPVRLWGEGQAQAKQQGGVGDPP